MALVINSNISSLNAQRNLTLSQGELNTSMERLTSGKRINSAADDAAGLAISSRMTSQISGLDQAVRNANDGISLIQTAEGALEESTNILQRMRELAIQSANGIYSDGDRATLDAEVQQLIEELDRISETTSFNGSNILDGTLSDVSLQVGAEAYQTISFSITATDTSSLGLGSTSGDLTGDRISSSLSFDEGDIQINGVGLSAYDEATDNLDDLLEDINSIDGVSASAFNVVEADSAGTGVLSDSETLRITLGSVDGGADINYDISDTTDLDDLVDKINSTTAGAVEASLDDSGKLVLSNTTGGTITLSYDDAAPFSAAAAGSDLESITGIDDASSDGTETFTGIIALSSDDGGDLTVTTGANGTDTDLNNLGFSSVSGAGLVTGTELTTSSDGTANTALASGDLKINGVSIEATESTDGLAGKIDAINAVTDETGVSASIVAEASYTVDLTSANAYTELVQSSTSLVEAATTSGDLLVNGVAIAITSGDSTTDIAAAINAETSSTGVTAYTDDDGALHLGASGPITLNDSGGALLSGLEITSDGSAAVSAGTATTASTPTGTGEIKINNTTVSLTDLTDVDQILDDINSYGAATGVTASIDENGELQLSSSAAITIEVGNSNGLSTANALGISFDDSDTDGSLADDTVVIKPRIALDSEDDAPITIELTTNGATATGLKELNTDLSSTVSGSSLSSISIATAAGAQEAIDSIDNALETISDIRSGLGAVSNRLDFTINNLSSISENTSAALSRIEDADYAAESASLSRAQVLQQAGTAMLAQANAQPQQVLTLLQ